MASLRSQAEPVWQIADDLNNGSLQAAALKNTTATVRDDALKLLRPITGPDFALSNYPRRGTRTHADVKTRVRNQRASILFDPPILWGLIERGARPHTIGAGTGRRGRLVMPIGRGRVVTGPIRHPGMPSLGKPATKALKNVADLVADDISNEIERRV
jgi:hypothetical protein